VDIHADEIVGDAGANADGGLSAASRIPSKSQARFEVSVTAIHVRFTVDTGIADIKHARGSVRKHLTSDAAIEIGEIDTRGIAILECDGNEGIPSNAIRDSQPPRGFPSVGCIQGKEVLLQIFGIWVGLMLAGDSTGQKIDKRRTEDSGKYHESR